MKEETKIALSFKCSEKWGGMAPVTDARYSMTCNKTVKDYYSRDVILTTLKKLIFKLIGKTLLERG